MLGPFSVEWFESRAGAEPLRARIDVEDSNPDLLVQAVLEARRLAGSTLCECVLSVAQPLSFHRVLTLPPLARRDLEQVLRRRAETAAGEAGSVYCAQELAPLAGEEPRGAEKEWLLAGTRALVRLLCRRLGERNLLVRRVVASELCAFEQARRAAPDPAQPVLALLVAEGSTAVGLVHAGRILYQESIQGDLAARAALGTALLHEIRTCASFWKKKSRGGGVTQVVVLGLPRERVELLGLSLATILPGCSVQCVRAEPAADARLDWLEAQFATGELALDLTFFLPRRRRALAWGGALALIATAGGAFALLESGSEEARALQAEAVAVRRATSDLEDLAAEAQAVQVLEQEVRAELARNRELAALGVPFERTLQSVLGAFQGLAEVSDMRIFAGANGEPDRLHVVGQSSDDPAVFLARVRDLVARLERDPRLAAIQLTLPERFTVGVGSGVFTLDAEIRG
jgi:hypothetical protein